MKYSILSTRFVALSLLATLSVCSTGCLHALGLNRSSLTPRSAHIQQTESTLASADVPSADVGFSNDGEATVRSQSADGDSAAGHSASRPTISLLRPTQTPNLNPTASPTPQPITGISFQTMDSLKATRQPTKIADSAARSSTATSFELPDSMTQRPPASQSAIKLNPPAASHQNRLGFDAAKLRQFMNQQSQNPMASGHVLADKKAKWDVLRTNGTSGHSTNPRTSQSQLASPTMASTTTVSPTAASPLTVSPRSGVLITSDFAAPDVGTEFHQTNNPFQLASNPRYLDGSESESPSTADSNSTATTEDAFEDSGWTDVVAQQPFPTAEQQPASSANEGGSGSNSSNDDSMLNRLKGLYDPAQDGVARRIWGRQMPQMPQMPKLPNPWSVFREREREREQAISAGETTDASKDPVPDADRNSQTAGLLADANNATSQTTPSLLAQLALEYEERLNRWPRTPAERPENAEQYQKLQQELRLLYLMQDRPEDAMSAVELLSPAEQQFWQSMMMCLVEYREAKVSESPSSHFTGSVHQLRTAIQALSPLADLRIRRLEICDRIHSFGRIETFPTNDLDAGKPLLLYVELGNFGTQMTPSGRYLTSFDATLQIFAKDEDSAKETIRLTDITDESTSARTDYFQSYDLTLPSHLMTGEYEIRLKLRDKLTGKTAQSTVSFQVR